MRILDVNANTAIKNVILYLDIDEANELYDSIRTLLENRNYEDHVHIDDKSYEHEITVVLYDNGQIDLLDERSKCIILKDK